MNNGVEMPILGYGIYQTPARITEQCVADALRVGYRSIDTAHGKTVAQVALRFLPQQGIIVIPKSTHIERMKENLESLDFELGADEMRDIQQLEIGRSLFGWW